MLQRFYIASLLAFLLHFGAGMARAQVPDIVVEPPPKVEVSEEEARKLHGTYHRPDLSPEILNLSAVEFPAPWADALVGCLAKLVRDYPDSKLLSLEWKSRILGIALRLRPTDFRCVVADGQLARGIVPTALSSAPAKVDTLATEVLESATALLAKTTDKQSVAHRLGLHLLDLAAHLDPSNQAVVDIFMKDSPALLWARIAPGRVQKPVTSDEEVPDLRRTHALVNLLARGQDGIVPGSVAASATKSPDGKRRALQLFLPQDSDPTLEQALPGIRSLLKGRTSQWPAGWRIDLAPFKIQPPSQPPIYLGVTMLLDSLITGNEIDSKALLACGIDPVSGSTVKLTRFTSLLGALGKEPDGRVIVIPEPEMHDVLDLLLMSPEKAQDIIRLNFCVARNLAESVELCSKSRPAVLQRSLDQHKALVASVRSQGIASLRTPAVAKMVDSILEMNPNLFSVRVMQIISRKAIPAKLSKQGSLNLLRQLGDPMLNAGTKPYPIKNPWRDKLAGTPWSKSRIQIDRLRPMLADEARAYADALSDLGKAYDVLVLNPPVSPQGKDELNKRIAKFRNELRTAYQALKPPPAPEVPGQTPPPPSVEERLDAKEEF